VFEKDKKKYRRRKDFRQTRESKKKNKNKKKNTDPKARIIGTVAMAEKKSFHTGPNVMV